MSETTKLVVFLNDPDRVQEIADQLKAKGFVIEKTLEAIGVISGHIPNHMRPSLSTIKGIKIEEDRDDYSTSIPH